MQYHANPTLVDGSGRNPLHVACASSRQARVVRQGVAVVDSVSGRRTAEGYNQVVRVLLEGWGDYLIDW